MFLQKSVQSLCLREDLGVCSPAASSLLVLNGSENPWLGAISCKPHADLYLALGHHAILSQSFAATQFRLCCISPMAGCSFPQTRMSIALPTVSF